LQIAKAKKGKSMMDTMMKELKAVLSYYGLPQESVEQFESILYSQIEENADEVQEYLDML